MMKTFYHISFLTAFALLAAFASCTREPEPGADGPAQKKVAYIALSAESGASGVKSSLGADYKVSWEAGDDILYYTGSYAAGAPNTAMTENGSYKVPASGDAVSLPVEYRDGDNRVTILTKGRSVGAVTSPATLNSITVEDAVPASQTGTFASCYLAAAEGNLLELAAGTGNVSLTRLQSYIRFKLSSLTVGDRTVNRIEITGTSTAGGDKVCGDLTLGITENASHTVTAAPSAAPDALGTTITIDRTASKFNANEYIYAALLPYKYTQLTFTLYSGATKVASVPVIRSGGTIDATQGRLVDIGEVNSHAKIAFVSAKMYPERVAITKDHTTKKLWLRIEPSDFDVNNVQWSSSDTTLATVPATGAVVTMDGIGKCTEVTVSNKCGEKGLGYTDSRNVTISAEIHSPEDGSVIDTMTCVISIGEWVDLGLKTSDGKRCLWARQCVKYKDSEWSLINNPNGSDDSGSDRLYEHFGWGEIQPALTLASDTYHALTFAWGTSSIDPNGEYEKYNKTNRYPYLQRKSGEFTVTDSKYNTVDDPCTLWGVANGYTTADDPVVHAPMILDCAELLNNIIVENMNCTSTVAGYTDVFIIDIPFAFCSATTTGRYGSPDVGGFWTAEYCIDSPVRAIVCRPSAHEIVFSDRYRRGHFRPVMYVE